MPLMSNVMCPLAEVRMVLAKAAIAVLLVQLGGGVIARRANGPCFMAGSHRSAGCRASARSQRPAGCCSTCALARNRLRPPRGKLGACVQARVLAW